MLIQAPGPGLIQNLGGTKSWGYSYFADMSGGNPTGDWLIVGDSFAQAYQATSVTTRWTTVTNNKLRTAFGATGTGLGYVNADFQTGGGILDYPVTYAGAPTRGTVQNTGLGKRRCTLNAIADKAICTYPMTGIDIVWTQTVAAGSFSWQVDGGGATTVNTGGGASITGGHVTQIRGLGVTSHAIQVNWVSGNPSIEGFMIYNGDEASGIRFWDGSLGGAITSQFAGDALWSPLVSTIQPSVLVLCIGINNFGLSIVLPQLSPSAYRADMLTIINTVRGLCTFPPSVLLVAEYRPSAYGTGTDAGWAPYVSQLYSLANADPTITVLDLYARTNKLSMTPANSQGLMNADGLHMTNAGNAWMAGFLTNAMTPS